MLQVTHVDLYVAEQFEGWRERALVNLSDLYNHDTHSFPANVSEQMVSRVSAGAHSQGKSIFKPCSHNKHSFIAG